ncbi:hypothetical protein [Colwellia echini]|uniref:DUF3718 domain-containing protein n=1 Tax=Colwellia echini TaxID=1982103 RepID=A0ABY3MXW8_9GAMM|nr:hypothetical protein [Colwellia echini]TYK66075.1 hypothetical protein CWS31_007350 [Colwellia echini]
MKSIVCGLSLLALCFTVTKNVAADEDIERQYASQEHIEELAKSCAFTIGQDIQSDAEINRSILVCVNEELNAAFYRPITKLPAASLISESNE